MTPPLCPLLDRGVYRAPLLGPHGEVILFAVDARHRRPDHGVVYVPEGEDLDGPTAALWRLLDAVDPEHSRREAVRERGARAS